MHSIRWLVGVLVCGLVLALPALSVAAGGPEQGRAAFAEGQRLFMAGNYHRALISFENGYEQTKDPAFLLNIAQCHRRLGEDQVALKMFRLYLKSSPEGTNPQARAIATKAITELESAAEGEPSASAAVVAKDATSGSAAPAPAAADPDAHPEVGSRRKFGSEPAGMPVLEPLPEVETATTSSVEETTTAPDTSAATARHLRLAAMVFGGVGLISGGAGFYYWTRARSLSDSANKAAIYNRADYDAGKRAEKMQWIFYGVAGGAVATGVGLLVYSSLLPAPAPKKTSVSLAPLLGPGAAGLTVGGTY